MPKPLISVVMPVFNAGKYIEKAIKSILRQTYENFELIIVDDCSEDNSLEIVQNISDSRIKLFCNEINKGIAYSTNLAIKHAKGKYVALMDDDDIALPNRLETQLGFMEKHEEIDVLGGASELVNYLGEHVSYLNSPRSNPKYIKAMLLFRCLDFANSTTMIRRQFIVDNNIWYRENYYGMQDYQFFIEASKKGKISSIDTLILQKRKHDDCYTDKQMTKNGDVRAECYGKMREESLKQSGFSLSTHQINVLNSTITELMQNHIEEEEFKELYCVFKEIIRQARDMEVDYINELIFVAKKLLSERLYRMDLFE